MKKNLLVGLILMYTFSASSQINFRRLKEKAASKLNSTKEDKLKKHREEQLGKDTTFYNYIFSQGSRASFFANRESKESALLTFGKKYEDDTIEKENLEVYEKVFDLNRSAEFSIYVNPKVATVNFAKAIALVVNDITLTKILFEEVVSIRELVNLDTMSLPEKYALGKTIANISIMTHAEGKHNLSEGYIDETIAYFEEVIGKESIALASLYNNKAVIFQSQGKYTQAEKYFGLSEKIILKKGKNESLSHAILISNKALLYNEIGQYKQAKSAIEKAIKIAKDELREKGRDNVSFRINKGLIYYSSGDYQQAEDIFNEILVLKRKRMAKNQTDYANVENYLASVLIASGKVSQVPDLLNDALRIFEQKYSVSHPAYIKTKHNLGKYYISAGDFTKAASILGEVNNSYLQNFGEYHPSYLSSLEDIAVTSWKLGSYKTATTQFEQVITTNLELVEKYFGAMSEHEKGQYWAKVRPSILKFYAYAVERGSDEPQLLTKMYDIHLKTKGILLSASTKIREELLKSDDEVLKNTFAEWTKTKEDLLLFYTYSKSQLVEQDIDIESIESKANQLEKELSRLSASFSQSNKLPTATMAQVKSKLGESDAAIEIIGYPAFDRSFTQQKKYAFLIVDRKNTHPRLVLLDNGNDLDQRYANAYRNTIKHKMEDQHSYGQYWKPIDDKLANIKNIYLSLGGIYSQINIGALKRPDNTYVSDVLNIQLYSSTRDLLATPKTISRNKNAAFFGYPDYGSQGLLQALPGTKIEIDAISKITRAKGYSTKTYMQKEASESNFKKISSPTILHIATHGFFLKERESTGEKVFGIEVNQAKDNPLLRSGLMLADAEQTMDTSDTQATEVSSTNNGVLTAYEVLSLDLKNTDLVVLSACETGLGEIRSGEGVYGLQRAFQIAGAGSVIMSLWKVSDEATKKLMTTFYSRWMGGMQKEKAFFTAQKELRKDFPEPYFWGAFILLN